MNTTFASFKPVLSALRPASAIAGLLLLSACATTGQQRTLQADDAHHVHDAARAALSAPVPGGKSATATSVPEEKLPAVKLTDELFYKILASEIAFQRGQWQASYVTLLSVAQQTRDPRIAKRAMEMALAARQPGEALSAIRLWRELSPESNEATQYYLGFMLTNGELDEIKSVYSQKLAESQPAQRGILMLQAQRLLSRAKDKQAALNTLDQIVAPYQSGADAKVAQAQAALNAGDKVRAVREARQVLALKPDSELAILTIAQASAPTEAIPELQTFIDKNPGAQDLRIALASLLIEQKRYAEAAAQFRLILRDKPEDTNATYTLAVLALEQNQLDEAEAGFIRYLQLSEQKSEERDLTMAYLNLARIAYERKNPLQAQEWLAKVDAMDGRNPAWFGVQLRRASLYARMGNLNQAREILHTTTAGSQNEEIQLIQTEAQLLRDSGSVLETIDVLRQGIKRFPEASDLMYDYAMVLESQQNFTEMEKQLRKVIQLAPENQHAYNALGYSFADRNIRLDEATTLIEKANQLAPEDPYILDSLGWVHFRKGEHAKAEEILRKAFSMRTDPEIAAHLGEVLWIKGDQAAALQIWRDALKKDASNQSLRSTLERLKVQP
ncbi:tetratricopeptide repeat protein [Undibacterium squillarum]|uniref:tetratricopeptide repeat protein n=1 Tax=Undibacterium squillarum TaxID=1131567 RepID=UPI0035B005C8